MAESRDSWWSRHRRLVTRSVIALLLVIVGAESFLLYLQLPANRAVDTQSARLLNAFLQRDTVEVVRAPGVPVRLQNVRFKWSDHVYIDSDDLAVRAMPVQGTKVDFDDLGSFLLIMQKSEVRIRPEVLEGMLNESVFNYPESKLRDLKVALTTSDGQRVVQLSGKIKTILWIPFQMNAHLSVDTATNTLVIEGDHIKVLGVLRVTSLLKTGPLQLEHLISVPPNQSLMVDGNRIMLKPFSLFPPPRINGRIASVAVDHDMIRLGFAGAPIPAPTSSAKNYVYLKGGESTFGSFCMQPTDILIVDQHPEDIFSFSLAHYADLLPKSRVETDDLKSARITMPDYLATGR
jgi:hypothetical protein